MEISNKGQKCQSNILARLKSINKGYLHRKKKTDFWNNLLLILIDSIVKVIQKISDYPISFYQTLGVLGDTFSLLSAVWLEWTMTWRFRNISSTHRKKDKRKLLDLSSFYTSHSFILAAKTPNCWLNLNLVVSAHMVLILVL